MPQAKGIDSSIRKMICADIDDIMRIWLDCNVKAHHFIPASYWLDHYDDVKRLIAQAEVYVCEISKKIVGFIGLSDNYIAGIFVDPDLQSQGIGKKLLDSIKAFKPQLLLHVYCKNRRAVKFYQRENFVIDSEDIDADTGEQEFLMKFV